MNPLEPPDTHYVLAAQGWLELGNHREATAELDAINPACRTHPDVLEVRWGVQAADRNWEACIETATTLLKSEPQRIFGWIHRSFALHELRRTREAAQELLPAASIFPENWLVRYNLACYACQLGNQTEAWNWLEKAFEIGNDKDIREMALEDPDLLPLRGSIEDYDLPF